MKKVLIALIYFSFSFSALSEYRVFQYLVKSTAFKNQDKDARIVTSTLDPVSYKAYHTGSLNVTVDLMRTWMCPGYTGYNLKPCPSPYEVKDKEENTLVGGKIL